MTDTVNDRDARRQRPVGVDVFAGAGGMSLGFEMAGFDVLAAIDNDPVHLAIHARNFPDGHPVCEDVRGLSVETIHAAIRKGWSLTGRPGEWNGVIDCLFGGPTCQGFSDMGRQQSDDERNDLIFSFASLVEELAPRTFVMENVPGLLFPKVRPKLNDLLDRLRSAGYALQSEHPQCWDASQHGVPQRRRRVFIIGVVDGVDIPACPAEYGGPTVSEALDDLPNVEEFNELIHSDQLVVGPNFGAEASTYVQSLRRRTGLEYEREWDAQILTGCQRTQHTAAVRARFDSLVPGTEDEVSRTSRLRGDGFSQTLRAGTGRDHGSYTAPRPIHHRHPRVLTVREAARLHSFPDWFDFNAAKWHALREIGNSVPPRLAHAVATTVVAALKLAPLLPKNKVTLGDESLRFMSLQEAADHFGIDRRLLPADIRRRNSPSIK